MTQNNCSPVGFELQTGSVYPSLPLLFRIIVVDPISDTRSVIYVGKSDNGAADLLAKYDNNIQRLRADRSARNGKRFRQVHWDLDKALKDGKSVVFELVRNVDPATESIAAAKIELQRAHTALHD
ncbi:hypothetical protein [Paraburkholderia hospita]|uniref:hypothetical protein n=1 Tax=Paraburkholderia hospita TaxID=169430 RepID=UPI0009D3DF73|nr:hypothetical protein [Paraburkholderia hospita]SKC49510.1 hypothetical protein SAMN05446934_0287 [Paraburkholderia hospita]